MKTIGLMLTGLLMAVGVFLGALPWATSSWATEYVTVPGVIKMSTNDACKTLRAAGLNCQIEKQVDYINEPKPVLAGTVSRQLPAARSRQPRGTTVRLTTYQQKWITVPNLINLNVSSAESNLRALGVKSQRHTGEASDPAKKNLVYAISPAAGTKVKPGSLVTLSVYQYAPITMPDLRGLNSQKACERLSKLGLNCKTGPGETTCDAKQAHKVIAHFPKPQASVVKGSNVTLTVTTLGAVTIPRNILGMNYLDAQAAMGSKRPPFTLNWTSNNIAQKRHTVWKVEPMPGTSTTCARPVTLWVYK